MRQTLSRNDKRNNDPGVVGDGRHRRRRRRPDYVCDNECVDKHEHVKRKPPRQCPVTRVCRIPDEDVSAVFNRVLDGSRVEITKESKSEDTYTPRLSDYGEVFLLVLEKNKNTRFKRSCFFFILVLMRKARFPPAHRVSETSVEATMYYY